jgi:hypothetical protein
VTRASSSASGGTTSHCASGARPTVKPCTSTTGIAGEYSQLCRSAVFIHSLAMV